MRIATLVTAFACIATASSAFTNRYTSRLDVNPINGTQFEVIEGYGEGARGMFCAAAVYAEQVLGVRGGRVYVLTPRGPSRTVQGRKGAVFTVDANDVTPAFGASVTVKQPGYGLRITHALQFCSENLSIPD